MCIRDSIPGIRIIPAGIHDTDQFTGIIRTPIPRETIVDTDPVSYTHLDVYKRQVKNYTRIAGVLQVISMT